MRKLNAGMKLLILLVVIHPVDVYAEFTVPDCHRLELFQIGQIKSIIRDGDQSGIITKTFGAPLADWSSEDISNYKKKMFACRKESDSFYEELPKYYFLDEVRGPVAEAASILDTERLRLQSLGLGKPAREANSQKPAALTEAEAQAQAQLRAQLKAQVDTATQQRDLALKAEQEKAAADKEAAIKLIRLDEAKTTFYEYAFSEFCLRRWSVFESSEVNDFKAIAKKKLDDENVSPGQRDSIWTSYQEEFQNAYPILERKSLGISCEVHRLNLVDKYPRIFKKATPPARTIIKSPL